MQITIFPDIKGKTLDQQDCTWGAIVDACATPQSYTSKSDLPLIKLATFGETASEAGCLRINENVLNISGIEGDYDGEEVQPSTAHALLLLCGVTGVVYTTPSHTPDKPRWRVLCPLSGQHPPDARREFAGRLNGVLGGILASESFTLSQAFYFCRVEGAMYESFSVEGEFIDKIVGLEPLYPAGATAAIVQATPQTDREATDENIEELRSALKFLSTDNYPDRIKIGIALSGLGDRGHGLWVEWLDSAGRTFAHETHSKWATFQPQRTGWQSIFTKAQAAGWPNPKAHKPIDMASVFGNAPMPETKEFNAPGVATSYTGSGEDVENGRLFANNWRGKLLFVHETNDVLRFDDGAGWIIAPPGEADRAAKFVLETMHNLAAAQYKTAPDDPRTKRLMDQVKRTSKAPNLRAMIDMAASENGMTKSLNEFDADPMQLGVFNGVLDLNTGKLMPVSPSLFVTKRSPVIYDETAICPQWEEFLADVQPDSDMREFLQAWAGYCLTGSVQEQKYVFLHGGGANGKSVFIELLAWMLGDYATKIATEMLMQHQRSPQNASPDIVSLKGRRFVYANETEEGRKLAEAKVKDMTGGDTLTGRVPYGKADITFQPTHKLAIVGNHKPEIGDSSNGMWRRVCLVVFDVTIEENLRDPKLLEKLKAEGAGILNWALAGLQNWQQDGLSIPKKIEAATTAYREDQDTINEWIGDCCKAGIGHTAKKKDLYQSYREWALANGHHPFAQKRLTLRLGERGYRLQPDKRTIAGLSLISPFVAIA